MAAAGLTDYKSFDTMKSKMNIYQKEGEIYFLKRRKKFFPFIDTIILDIDGVLINVAKSFRYATSLTVKFYFKKILGYKFKKNLINIKETELFKLAGGFNDDWDLTFAVVYYYLYKIEKYANQNSLDELKELPPSLLEWTQDLKNRGGGLPAVNTYLSSNLTPLQQESIRRKFDQETIRRIFMECYAGSDKIKEIYGIKPKFFLNQKFGLFHREKRIIKTFNLPPEFKYGIITGRTWGETKAAFLKLGLKNKIKKEAIICQDDGIRKPNPQALFSVGKNLGTKIGIYVGDTIDDLKLVKNYQRKREKTQPLFLSSIVLSGPAGKKNQKFFENMQADIIAPDINKFMQFMTKIKESCPGERKEKNYEESKKPPSQCAGTYRQAK